MQPVLDFADKLTLSPAMVGQADVNALRDAGWSDQAVEDVIGIVSVFGLLNRVLHGFGIKGSQAHFLQTAGILAQDYGRFVEPVEQKARFSASPGARPQ